jgi:hypothetical protein
LKNLILISILFLPLSAFSQKKKDLLISGGLGGYYTKTEVSSSSFRYSSGKNFVYELNPTLGFFFIKSLSAGIGVELIKNTTINEVPITNNTFYTYIMISPNVKYYFPFHLFLQVQYNYGDKISKYEREDTPGFNYYKSSYKETEILSGAGMVIGYSIKISNSFSIEPSFKYLINFINSSYERYGYDNLSGGKGNQQMFLFNVAITNFISLK